VNLPEWWWPGLLIQLVIFLAVVIGLGRLLMRWGQREVEKLDHDVLLVHASQQAFERELRARLWEDDGTYDDGGAGGTGATPRGEAVADDGDDHPGEG